VIIQCEIGGVSPEIIDIVENESDANAAGCSLQYVVS
jgi:hypothetical protein